MTRCTSRRGKDRTIIVAAKASNVVGGYIVVGILVCCGVMKLGVKRGDRGEEWMADCWDHKSWKHLRTVRMYVQRHTWLDTTDGKSCGERVIEMHNFPSSGVCVVSRCG